MSEEVAAAAADVAHIERLREQLNYEQLRAEDALRERDDTRAALRSLLEIAKVERATRGGERVTQVRIFFEGEADYHALCALADYEAAPAG